MKHPLTLFREAEGLSVAAVAKLIGITRQNVYRIEARKFRPDPDVALAIVEASGGKIAMEDLYRQPGQKDAA